MTEAYNDALQEQAKKKIWDTVREEAKGMSKADYIALTADITGIFDPTPLSDAVSGTIALAQGDFLGAALSVASFIPYAGDALAKPAKIMKRAPKTAELVKVLLKRGDKLAKASKEALEKSFDISEVAAAREKALERVKRAMLDARNDVPGCKDCEKLRSKKSLQMPKTKGKWDTVDGAAPANGNGWFTFDKPVKLPGGQKVTSVQFQDGFPDFTPYVYGEKKNLWVVTGDAAQDAKEFEKLMKGDPNWKPPSAKDYTLHHFEDGTVGYVPSAIHDRTDGGTPHTGGNSMINNDLF
ncbi:hypothetical protein [Azospirillum sp. B2RO_4]|uniref:hypothetical protein n=1 Tax=Azospirillum sp. B2RO_4 TaxID=3027796 RepID=UPI003DA9F13C